MGFDVATEFQDLEFKPVPGGAVMSYTLPKNLDIFGVRVRYTDAWGGQQMRDGSYLADTLLLDGFTEAQSGVPAQVCFFDHNMMESAPMDVTFATEKSATVAVFDNLAVNPFWGGFNVTYTAPEEVNGIIHVFYIGTNPLTHEPDSILLTSVPITEGGDTLNFVPQQGMDSYDVVVRTDDYKGKRIKQAVFAGLFGPFGLLALPGGLLALHPLIDGPRNILVHAFACLRGGGLYLGLFAFGQGQRQAVKVCGVPTAVPLFAGLCVLSGWHLVTLPS